MQKNGLTEQVSERNRIRKGKKATPKQAQPGKAAPKQEVFKITQPVAEASGSGRSDGFQ